MKRLSILPCMLSTILLSACAAEEAGKSPGTDTTTLYATAGSATDNPDAADTTTSTTVVDDDDTVATVTTAVTTPAKSTPLADASKTVVITTGDAPKAATSAPAMPAVPAKPAPAVVDATPPKASPPKPATPTPAPATPPAPGTASSDGATVFTVAKCASCHSITAKGIAGSDDVGGDLSVAKHDAIWIARWLRKEIELDGSKHMKKFPGTEADLKKLSEWLASLK